MSCIQLRMNGSLYHMTSMRLEVLLFELRRRFSWNSQGSKVKKASAGVPLTWCLRGAAWWAVFSFPIRLRAIRPPPGLRHVYGVLGLAPEKMALGFEALVSFQVTAKRPQQEFGLRAKSFTFLNFPRWSMRSASIQVLWNVTSMKESLPLELLCSNSHLAFPRDISRPWGVAYNTVSGNLLLVCARDLRHQHCPCGSKRAAKKCSQGHPQIHTSLQLWLCPDSRRWRAKEPRALPPFHL